MSFPVVELEAPRWVRLVASARLRDPVLHLLLRHPDRSRAELETLARDLAEIEGATSARLAAQQGAARLFPDGRPHANFVNAAFAYFRPREANRFNDAAHGAWYAARAPETGLAEVAYHLGRELQRVNDFRATVDYAELWASFAGAFVDLRGVQPAPPCLHPDTAIGYPAGNLVAAQARAAGHEGIVYPSVRHGGGVCLVALWPHAVSSVAQGALHRLVWDGAVVPRVERLAA